MLKSLMLLFERASAARKSKGSNRRDRACFKRRLQRNFAHRSGTHGCSAASEKFANRKATKEGAIWKLCALSQLPRWLRLTPFSTEDASALGFVPGVLGTGKIDCFFNRSDASTGLVFAPKKPDAVQRSASVALVASLCLGGCASSGAPTYSIVGAFFPRVDVLRRARDRRRHSRPRPIRRHWAQPRASIPIICVFVPGCYHRGPGLDILVRAVKSRKLRGPKPLPPRERRDRA